LEIKYLVKYLLLGQFLENRLLVTSFMENYMNNTFLMAVLVNGSPGPWFGCERGLLTRRPLVTLSIPHRGRHAAANGQTEWQYQTPGC
jgi:hypothetical protein